MVHGGTNFGFTSGANYDKKRDIQPDLTSYDYDVPMVKALSAHPYLSKGRQTVASRDLTVIFPLGT